MRDGWRIAAIGALCVAASAGLAAVLALSPAPAEPARDARAWVLEARRLMDADRFEEAVQAYERGLAASRKVAADPQVWCELADALGMAQGGRLAGRPAEHVRHALTLDARHPKALELAGSLAYEAGDYREAATLWEQLLAQLPPGGPRHAELSAAIERARSM